MLFDCYNIYMICPALLPSKAENASVEGPQISSARSLSGSLGVPESPLPPTFHHAPTSF
jgi:hypothetical protein